jgi:predicted tellurium resistance membrane protein TerC
MGRRDNINCGAYLILGIVGLGLLIRAFADNDISIRGVVITVVVIWLIFVLSRIIR